MTGGPEDEGISQTTGFDRDVEKSSRPARMAAETRRSKQKLPEKVCRSSEVELVFSSFEFSLLETIALEQEDNFHGRRRSTASYILLLHLDGTMRQLF